MIGVGNTAVIKQMPIADEYQDTEQTGQVWPKLLPIALLVAMGCAFFGLAAVLPLQNLRFHDALINQLSRWSLWPTHILFPQFPVIQDGIDKLVPRKIVDIRSWKEIGLLYSVLVLVFLLYLLAIRYLPRLVTPRYIFISTLFLGLVCVSIPVVTSSDVFSYVAYTRMGVIYQLNPLSTLPIQIVHDPIYKYLYWTSQPSIYGPTWILITCFLQWLLLSAGVASIPPMVLVLRLLGLAMHLASTYLIWSISGTLQKQNGFVMQERRMLATLAFAWNPLLLFEAGVNAHADTMLLVFILLALWLLIRGLHVQERWWSVYMVPILIAIILAFATSIKVNAALVALGLVFFLLTQTEKVRKVVSFTLAYLASTVLLYAPFWQGSVTFRAFRDNPATFRNINSLPDFLGRLYNAIAADFGQPVISPHVYSSPAIHFMHLLSLGAFVLIFGILCWRALWVPSSINSVPALVRWLAVAWLLYCAIGSPWFWPWYTVSFFGLFALLEATSSRKTWSFAFLRLPLAVRIMAFSMLSMYSFYAWAPQDVYVPGLPGFLWANFCGLYVWMLPLLANQWLLRSRLVSLLQTHKLRETRWQEVRSLLERSIPSLKSRPEL